MKNKNVVLLQTLRRATGNTNIIRYSTDDKRRNRARGDIAGHIVLYVFLLAYCIAMAIGYGMSGITEAIPVTAALTIAMVGFFLTLIKTNGYMFNFKEYDMLMAMPIKVSGIVGSKFIYMYVKSLPLLVITSLSMMIGYGIYAEPSFLTYVLWTVLSFVLPLIPMVIASALGALFSKIGSGMRHKNLAQAFFIVVFVILAVSSRFLIEAFLRKGEGEEMMEDIAGAMNGAAKYYLPAAWFTESVTECRILPAVLLITVSVGLFMLFALIVSRSYRQINSALMSGSAHVDYHMEVQKTRTAVGTIAFKEFKRFAGSVTYLTNVGLGVIFAVILGTAALFVPADRLIASVLQGAPITKEMLMPAIPMIIYFFLGMVPTTCCSPSLEGRNYWIIRSMPVRMTDVCRGKIRFNLILMMPAMAYATIALGISSKAPFIDIILYLIEGAVLLIFSSCFGLVMGLKYMRTDWENEVEVVKQGSAVGLYLLPNMFGTMGLLVGAVVLGMHMSGRLVTLAVTVLAAVLAALTIPAIRKRAER